MPSSSGLWEVAQLLGMYELQSTATRLNVFEQLSRSWQDFLLSLQSLYRFYSPRLFDAATIISENNKMFCWRIPVRFLQWRVHFGATSVKCSSCIKGSTPLLPYMPLPTFIADMMPSSIPMWARYLDSQNIGGVWIAARNRKISRKEGPIATLRPAVCSAGFDCGPAQSFPASTVKLNVASFWLHFFIPYFLWNKLL